MSYDDHDLCGSFCECGPEVTPMTDTERAEYQAETARLRAANVARVQQDAENLRAYDKATRDALQALRDTDHAAAIVIDREVYPLLRGMGTPDRMRLQVEDDHATAVLANIAYDTSTPAYVVQSALMMLRPDNERADILNMDRDMALVEYRKVLARRYLDRACEQCGPDADHSNRDHQEVVDMVERANTHDAEPHSRRPTECRVCGRLIVGRFDDGKALRYTHREKASL